MTPELSDEPPGLPGCGPRSSWGSPASTSAHRAPLQEWGTPFSSPGLTLLLLPTLQGRRRPAPRVRASRCQGLVWSPTRGHGSPEATDAGPGRGAEWGGQPGPGKGGLPSPPAISEALGPAENVRQSSWVAGGAVLGELRPPSRSGLSSALVPELRGPSPAPERSALLPATARPRGRGAGAGRGLLEPQGPRQVWARPWQLPLLERPAGSRASLGQARGDARPLTCRCHW